MALEGFSVFNDVFMVKMAGSVNKLILHKGATGFAPDVSGGVNAGIPLSGYPSVNKARWAILPYTELGRWDSSGTIINKSKQVCFDEEKDTVTLRRIFIPAGIVFA